MNLSTKIIATVSAVIGLLLIVGVLSYSGLSSIGKEMDQITKYQLALNNSVMKLQKNILKEEIMTYELLLSLKNGGGIKSIRT